MLKRLFLILLLLPLFGSAWNAFSETFYFNGGDWSVTESWYADAELTSPIGYVPSGGEASVIVV